MLVLSRQLNDKIMIDDNIVITIVGIIGDKVRLGFEAPDNVKIHRQEVYLAIKRQEAEARLKQHTELHVGVDGVSRDAEGNPCGNEE